MLCNRNCKGESCKQKACHQKQTCNEGEYHLHILMRFLWLAFQWPKIDIGSQTYNPKSTLINCKVNQSQFTNTEKKLDDVQNSKEKNSWMNWTTIFWQEGNIDNRRGHILNRITYIIAWYHYPISTIWSKSTTKII